ncbi:damage-inducible protein CinA [Dyadobacter luteus]|uniref:Damage-inducible protein CinA n=1 Tax=Dyadobacter luteus TaxID=2259619 RepID=A0A3D8YAT2_9BACT|nr:nicotinamide-nucleotide amidohydrolase family protein [Dyadobacter luteus]REA60887.1 damage-inducible protein CinA [Dyadobacter luteus]
MASPTVSECSKMLHDKGLTIAFAESASAGRLSSEFALTTHSGGCLKGGLVCYDACVKEDILHISPELIERYTAESAEVTREMAMKLKTIIPSDIQVAITGLTTPGGSETAEKPVGTMFVHILIQDRPVSLRRLYTGQPEQIILNTIDEVAETIMNELHFEVVESEV